MKHATQGRRGRPSKPYETSWGEKVHGLRREGNGSWRIISTRKTFSEPDERLAVQRFRAWESRQTDSTIRVEHEAFDSLADFHRALNHPAADLTVTVPSNGALQVSLGIDNPAGPFWATVRRLLIDQPQLVADMTGLASIVTWAQLNAPKPSIPLARLRDLYHQQSHAKPDSRREAVNTFNAFMAYTKAETLADLTTQKLIDYRTHASNTLGSPATVAAYFGRIKNIVRFGKSEGEDEQQIDAALSRLAVLKAPKDERVHNPTPISREHFHALHDTAGKLYPDWQPRLLIMLNCCLHFDEALDVEWGDFDLSKATFCTKRNKRGRVIRASTLWPETVKALLKIKRTGSPHVFVSKHGTRFNAKGQWKTWDKLRISAKCPDVQMDDIRDGAYTAACNAAGVEEKHARLMAGHRSHGLQDNYVQRNPAIVRPACEAIHKAYFG